MLKTDSVKLGYIKDDTLDLTGLVVTVNYNNYTNTAITTYTSSPANGSSLSTIGEIPVTISYTEGGVTKSAYFAITVTPITGTQGLAFELINGGTAYRVRKGTVTSGVVVIPATYEGLPVTEIGSASDDYDNGAFYSCYEITSVTIPASITSIGSQAFGFSHLTSVFFAMDSQLTFIGNGAFDGCVFVVGIAIPAGVTSIGDRAFSQCYRLTSIVIPDNVLFIGQGAFYACHRLTGITVSTNNPNYTSESGILYDKSRTTLIQAPLAGISDNVAIPASVKTIGYGSFAQCDSLTSITIPNSVTAIGESAFSQCDNLTSITIPASVTSIGHTAFMYCTNLTSITIPASVTSIGHTAFMNCTNLTSITIPASVTSIGVYTFSGCTGLTNVTFEGMSSDVNFPSNSFPGDLLDKYLAGGAGTYTRDTNGNVWTKQAEDIPVSFNSLSANGSSTQTTTQLNLTFSQAITGLTANDITLSGVSGVVKGALSGSGPDYTLGISGFTAGGTLNVAVSKTGYVISGFPKTATIYYYSAPVDTPVTFSGASANGNSTTTTTQLTLTFSQSITGLTANDITLSGVSGVIKGTLSGSGPTYYLSISGFTVGGSLNVSVFKAGYNISSSPKQVTIYYSGDMAGITLDVKQIIDGAPIIAAITISSTGSNRTYTVTVSNYAEYSSIAWEIAGADVIYAGPPVTGSGATFTLNAADSRYNSLGGHVLILTVIKGGMQYQRAIPFTIVQ